MLHSGPAAGVERPLKFGAGAVAVAGTKTLVAQKKGVICGPESAGPPPGWLVIVRRTVLPRSGSALSSLRPSTRPVTRPRNVRAEALAVKEDVMSWPFSFTFTLESGLC